TLLTARAAAVLHVAEAAAKIRAKLSADRERFQLTYEPRFVEGWPTDRIAAASSDDVATALVARLEATRTRDIAAGLTLIGPHRDDLSMTLGPTQLSSADEDHAAASEDFQLSSDDEDDESPNDENPTSNVQPLADQSQR